MHKLAFIAVGIFMIVGANITLTSQDNLVAAENKLSEDQYEILAQNAAVAGMERVKQKLADNFQNYYQVTGTNDGVSYTVNATVDGDEATVHSVGTTYMKGEAIEFNVMAKFKQRTVLPNEAPPQMRYAVISDEDLVLRGNIESEVYIDGNEDDELNANMHSNQNLKLNGNAALIKGFGTYYLTAQPSVAALEDNFIPNDNSSNPDHSVYQTTTIDIPELDLTVIAENNIEDESQVTMDDVELSGDYSFGGSRKDPYVWYIDGDLTINNGGTTIDGYVIFLVGGSADLKGNVQVGNSGYDERDESSIAIYTNGGVRMRGNSEIWGQIYSNGGIEFDSGTPAVYGSVTTRGTVDFRGTVDIFYREASPGLTQDLQPNLTILDRIAYSEW